MAAMGKQCRHRWEAPVGAGHARNCDRNGLRGHRRSMKSGPRCQGRRTSAADFFEDTASNVMSSPSQASFTVHAQLTCPCACRGEEGSGVLTRGSRNS